MRKCPGCAEENIFESLFCKHCGRCLLTPDPEVVKWSIAMHTEHYITPEGIEFYDGHPVKKSRVASLKRRPRTAPSVTEGWLLLLNSLVFFLMFEIARSVLSR